ncbi:MAG: hypothetical protein FD180_2576 [Planctomycetota bacterium]|nr:MAG: hypothetical protein FD180_2576 [Planctomycetota bacterium]
MAANALDFDKVKDFLGKHLTNISEASKVKFREIQKAVKHEFGQGLFMPKLSQLINSVRPDLAKPARKKAKRRRKAGKRGPGRPPGVKRGAGAFLVKVGRKLSLAKSKDRVQAIIDKMVAAGASLGRLKVFALSKVGVSTRVTIE